MGYCTNLSPTFNSWWCLPSNETQAVLRASGWSVTCGSRQQQFITTNQERTAPRTATRNNPHKNKRNTQHAHKREKKTHTHMPTPYQPITMQPAAHKQQLANNSNGLGSHLLFRQCQNILNLLWTWFEHSFTRLFSSWVRAVSSLIGEGVKVWSWCAVGE